MRRVNKILAVVRGWLRRPAPPVPPPWDVGRARPAETHDWLSRRREQLDPGRSSWLRPRP